jgi:glycerol kinase
VQWLRDGLGIIKNAAEIEALAASVPHTDGV